MSSSNLTFTLKEMESLVNGKWINLSPNLLINDFVHILSQVKQGDIFVVSYESWYNKKNSNEDEIPQAIKNGASALFVEEQTDISNINIPVFVVKNSYEALKKLAKHSSLNSKAKKLLITGSYGKTGFKNHLYTLSNQKNIYARLHSSNRFATTLCTLVSIKKDTKLFLIEVPIRRKDRIQKSSKYIKPNMCVITSIGHEHIEIHGSIEEIIRQKCLVASSLKEGEKVIIPGDSEYTKLLKKELKKYKGIVVLTFGESENCNAQILNKYFIDNKWVITARIEFEIIQYEVHFVEEHAPSSSVAELLCLKHMGEDIYSCANKFIKCKNYKSSGKLYKIEYKNKELLLYDQSSRGGVEGYKSFFKTIRRLDFKKNSRKIVLSSEFVDLKDGEDKFLDIQRFQELITKAEITQFYGVENFNHHEEVISDKTIYKGNYPNPNELAESFFDTLKDGDIICIKGIFESNINKVVKKLLSSSKPLPRYLIKEFDTNTLKGCEVLSIKHKELFKTYLKEKKVALWCQFFPFLFSFSKSKSKKILVKKDESSLSVFYLRNINKAEKISLQLFFIPFPFNFEVLKKSLNIVKQFNKQSQVTVTWLDDEDISNIKKHKEFAENIEFIQKEYEFIFDSSLYYNLAGGKLRSLRQQINWVNRLEDVKIVPYKKEYLDDALKLYDKWKKFQEDKYDLITDENYTKNALFFYESFKDELKGLVVLIKGELKAFGFYGNINETTINMFIAKSDLEIKGLQQFLKYNILLNSKDLIVNDGSAESQGLFDSKKKLNPLFLKKVYKARYNFI